MTTHADHDHPNTKAARAACRRAAGLIGEGRKSANDLPSMSAEDKARVKAGGPVRKPKAKSIHTSLPHAYDEDAERPGRCYMCKLVERARVHDGQSPEPWHGTRP